MEVLFATKKLQRQLTEPARLQRAFGATGSKKISLRLQQMQVAPSLEDMRFLPGRCHELSGDRKGTLAVDVEHPHRLVFRPTDNPPPLGAEGGLDWSRVESVTVNEVVDYH